MRKSLLGTVFTVAALLGINQARATPLEFDIGYTSQDGKTAATLSLYATYLSTVGSLEKFNLTGLVGNTSSITDPSGTFKITGLDAHYQNPDNLLFYNTNTNAFSIDSAGVSFDASNGGGKFNIFADANGDMEAHDDSNTPINLQSGYISGQGGTFGNKVVTFVRVVPTPEPISIAMFGVGLAGLFAIRRRNSSIA